MILREFTRNSANTDVSSDKLNGGINTADCGNEDTQTNSKTTQAASTILAALPT